MYRRTLYLVCRCGRSSERLTPCHRPSLGEYHNSTEVRKRCEHPASYLEDADCEFLIGACVKLVPQVNTFLLSPLSHGTKVHIKETALKPTVEKTFPLHLGGVKSEGRNKTIHCTTDCHLMCTWCRCRRWQSSKCWWNLWSRTVTLRVPIFSSYFHPT